MTHPMEMLDRPRRRRRRRPTVVALGGLAAIAVLGLLIYLGTRSVRYGLPFGSESTLFARVADPGNLKTANEVRIAGVRSGQVVEVIPDPEAGEATIEMRIDGDVEPLPADTEVALPAKGLLGARFVELRPGDSERTIEDGATIEGAEDALTFGVTDALETFDRRTRGRLGSMLGELGTGLQGRGTELNEAVRVAGGAGQDFRDLVGSILERDGAARRLLPALESSAAAFDDAREDFVGSLGPGQRALAPFVDRRDQVHELLEQGPSTLRAASSGFDRGAELLGAARSLAVAANGTLPAAPAGLRATSELLREGADPLARAARLARDARASVPDVLRITSAVRPLLDPIERAAEGSLPLIYELGRHGCELVNTGENWRSVLNQGSPGGGVLGPLTAFRVVATGGSLTGLLPSQEGYLTDVVKEPYPEPCAWADADVSFMDLATAAGDGR